MLHYIELLCNFCDPCTLHCELLPSPTARCPQHPNPLGPKWRFDASMPPLPRPVSHDDVGWESWPSLACTTFVGTEKEWCIFIWETGIIVHFTWNHKYDHIDCHCRRSPLPCQIMGPHNLQTLFGNQSCQDASPQAPCGTPHTPGAKGPGINIVASPCEFPPNSNFLHMKKPMPNLHDG